MTKSALGDHLPQFPSQRMHWLFEWWIQKWLLMTKSYPRPVTGPQPGKLLFPPRSEFPPYTHIVTHDQVTQGHEGETSCLLRGGSAVQIAFWDSVEPGGGLPFSFPSSSCLPTHPGFLLRVLPQGIRCTQSLFPALLLGLKGAQVKQVTEDILMCRDGAL